MVRISGYPSWNSKDLRVIGCNLKIQSSLHTSIFPLPLNGIFPCQSARDPVNWARGFQERINDREASCRSRRKT